MREVTSSSLEKATVEQVIYLLLVYLQERTTHCVLSLCILQWLNLVEQLLDTSWGDAEVGALFDVWDGCPITALHIIVTLHGISLTRRSLTIGEDGGVVSIDYLVDKSWAATLLVHVLLVVCRIENGVEPELFLQLELVLIGSRVRNLHDKITIVTIANLDL